MRALALYVALVWCLGTPWNCYGDKPHLLILFYNEADDKNAAVESAFDGAVQKLGDQIIAQKVDINDPSEATIINYYNLQRATMPLVMVFAPNGAIAARFWADVTEEKLTASLVSKGKADVLSGLQAGHVVCLCVQGSQTACNCQARRGVKDLISQSPYAAVIEFIVIDLADVREHAFLASLGIDSTIDKATTLMLAPPAMVIGRYEGKTSKERLLADLSKASVATARHGPRCSCGCCGHH